MSDEPDKHAQPVSGKDRLSGEEPVQGQYSRGLSNRMQAANALRERRAEANAEQAAKNGARHRR